MRKISLVLLSVIFFIGNAYGQIPYNPFTQNIHFEPEPTVAGFACGSVQTVAFTQGLTTSDNATLWQTEPLKVVICLTGFTFNGSASSVVTGSYSSNFDWAYNPLSPNCIIGTQNKILIGTGLNPVFPDPLSSGDIKLSLLVPSNSPISTVLRVDVILEVPAYMQAFNSVPDDNESTQTQTFCELSISGTIYNDNDTVNQLNDVNGIPIDTPSGAPLYVSLINANGIVVGVTTVQSNGTYIFLNVTPNATYTVVLSTNQGVIGQPTPIIELPPLWVNTGEDCCDQTGNDGNINGINTVEVIDISVSYVDFGIVGPPPTGPLPIVLSSFFVTEYNCGGLLSWTTAQEENTKHVDIYRKDGAQGSFRKIANVTGAGNSSVEKAYSYLDKEVKQNETYEYQLKFVDIDGQFTVSKIKTLLLNCSKTNTSINIFPNPVTTELNVLYVTEEDNVELTVEIIDIAGRTIIATTKEMISGGNVITLDINSLANGTYLLHYHDVEGLSVGALKFIKH